jgi:hypothetical protein
MIDWFVLVVPLILLLVLLPLAFVGCVLDREGTYVPPDGDVNFTYVPNLAGEEVAGSQVVSFEITWDGTLGGQLSVISRGGDGPPPIENGGETVTAGDVGIFTEGTIICVCNMTAITPPFDVPATVPAFQSLPKEKASGLDAPSFTLVREGNNFDIV